MTTRTESGARYASGTVPMLASGPCTWRMCISTESPSHSDSISSTG